MMRILAVLALSASAVLPGACEREPDTVAATPPGSGGPPSPAGPAGPAAAPGAPAYAVLYPGATLEDPAVTASDPSGPGGMVTFLTDADPETIIDFYRARAEQAGLASVMAMNQGDARAYGAAGPDATTSLQVVAAPTETDQTSVQLSWSAGL
jgi:hypothetical protein